MGISIDDARLYDDLPLASKCAMRWVAHHRRMTELEGTLADSIKVISYESFAQHTERTICELQHFLGMLHPIAIPDVRVESLQKWKQRLSAAEINQICEVVGFPPED